MRTRNGSSPNPSGGCYTTGYGQTADGISVVVAGGDFSTNTDDGTYVALLPDPSVVTVTDMQAGDHAVWVIIDC